MSSPAPVWDVILPLKPLARAKSRLFPDNPGLRKKLAIAFALDVASAAARCGSVARICVVGTPLPLPAFPGVELRWFPEPTPGHPDSPGGHGDISLNSAAAAAARDLRIDVRGRAVLILVADLPSVRSADIVALTDSFRDLTDDMSQGFVSDLSGRGTTALLSSGFADQWPMFGPDSARRHLEAGATDLSAMAATGLRRDVDDASQLRQAVEQGVGRATACALGLS